MKLKDILPQLTKKPKTNKEKAKKMVPRMKVKAKRNNPRVDFDSRNPAASNALQARSMNSQQVY